MNAATDRWSKASMGIHWASALVVVALLTVGFVMTGLNPTDPLRRILGRAHAISGVTLGLLTLARLVVRRRARPSEPLAVSDLHRKGIAVVHASLYAVVFGILVTGVATALRSDWHPYIKGEIAAAPALGSFASRGIHGALVTVLLALVAAHVVGVIVQQVRRGKTLRRMVPFLR